MVQQHITAVDRLESFLHTWPPGVQVTTRGLQTTAGLADLAEAQQAAEALRARGLIDRHQVGATSLWFVPEDGVPA